MKSPKKFSILAIGSHPDDIEFGCGGTLSRFVEQGNKVYMLILSDGSRGGEIAARREEQQTAAEILGIKEIFWGSFHDTRLPFYETVVEKIEHFVNKVEPTFVFVHYGKDTHQDHRHVNVCTISATRHVPNVLFYEGPTTFEFEPNVYVDINDCMEKKLSALKAHNSQIMRTNIIGRSILDLAQATAAFRGTRNYVPFAEAFVSLRLMFLLPSRK